MGWGLIVKGLFVDRRYDVTVLFLPDEWMDEWMNKWVGEWMDRRVEWVEWVEGEIEE
jgi:hypothetical protein